MIRPSSSDLSFPRAKRRSLLRSLAFRGQPLLVRTLGADRTLRLLLNAERASWRLAYEAAGAKYGEEFHNASAALTAEMLDQWLPAGASVLDIGCGTGRVGRALAGRVGSYLGIDTNWKAIEYAQAAPHPSHVRFDVGDAMKLPAGQFDVVLLAHVLEHIDRPVELLQSVRPIAPMMIVEVPAFDRCVLNRVRFSVGVDFSSDDDHVHEYTEPLLREQLRAGGWEPDEFTRGPMSIAAVARKG